MSRIRTALVGTVAAGLLLMSAGAASATPEPPATTWETTKAREVLDLGGGWFSNSEVTTNTSTQVSTTTRSKTESTVETDVVKSSDTRTVESTETNTVDASYSANVLPPINPDGSSVWPAKRGVIPVQFKVTESGKVEERSVSTPQRRDVTTTSERTVSTPFTATDTVTTKQVTKSPAFQSIAGSDATQWSVFGKYNGIPAGTTVADITKLQADFNWVQGASVGGSLRWDIGTEYGDLHVYYGDSHSWTGTGGSNVNLMVAADDRFDTSNLDLYSGPKDFYNTKAEILASDLANAKVNNLSMALDSYWAGSPQVVSVGSVTIGINDVDESKDSPLASITYPEQSTTVAGDWVAGSSTIGPWNVIDTQYGEWIDGVPTYGPWTVVSSTAGVQTNEPPAKLVVKKFNDGVQTEVLSETLTSAQADVGGNFRQVDHKYIYNLEASTLGKGDFKVYIQIDGVNLENHGEFTLR